jgi:hypothetical protein
VDKQDLRPCRSPIPTLAGGERPPRNSSGQVVWFQGIMDWGFHFLIEAREDSPTKVVYDLSLVISGRIT